MAEERWSALVALCQLELALLVPALLAVLVLQARVRETVGEILVAPARAQRLAARAAFALPPLLALAACVAFADVQREPEASFQMLQPAFECLAVAALIGWFSPAPASASLGVDGVQRGWRAWRYDELDEVRLAGSVVELRRKRDVWRVVVGPAELPQVRALLSSESASAPPGDDPGDDPDDHRREPPTDASGPPSGPAAP